MRVHVDGLESAGPSRRPGGASRRRHAADCAAAAWRPRRIRRRRGRPRRRSSFRNSRRWKFAWPLPSWRQGVSRSAERAALDVGAIHPHLPVRHRAPVLQEIVVVRRQEVPRLADRVEEAAVVGGREVDDLAVAGHRVHSRTDDRPRVTPTLTVLQSPPMPHRPAEQRTQRADRVERVRKHRQVHGVPPPARHVAARDGAADPRPLPQRAGHRVVARFPLRRRRIVAPAASRSRRSVSIEEARDERELALDSSSVVAGPRSSPTSAGASCRNQAWKIAAAALSPARVEVPPAQQIERRLIRGGHRPHVRDSRSGSSVLRVQRQGVGLDRARSRPASSFASGDAGRRAARDR